jgi:hypothetical protein
MSSMRINLVNQNILLVLSKENISFSADAHLIKYIYIAINDHEVNSDESAKKLPG